MNPEPLGPGIEKKGIEMVGSGRSEIVASSVWEREEAA